MENNAWTSSSIVLGDRRPGGGGEISLPLFPKTSYIYRQRGPARRKNFGLANGKRSTCSLRAERDRQKKIYLIWWSIIFSGELKRVENENSIRRVLRRLVGMCVGILF